MSERVNRKIRRLFPAWNFIEYSLVCLVMEAINLFPIAVSTWISRRIGDLMFLTLPKRRKIALENLKIAFADSKLDAERRRIARESFRHLATSLVEFFRLPNRVERLTGHVRLLGTEHLERAFARGKGAVLVMSHLGPWEYLAFLSYLKGYSITVLGRPVRNPYFHRWIKSLRKIMKLDYSDKTLGPRKIFSELKANHLVGITIDQWAGNEGLWVDFFNRTTSTTSLPARLAQRTGCALVPACCLRVGTGEYEIQILPEVPQEGEGPDSVEQTTKELNRLLEAQISSFPEQWIWTHKRWKK